MPLSQPSRQFHYTAPKRNHKRQKNFYLRKIPRRAVHTRLVPRAPLSCRFSRLGRGRDARNNWDRRRRRFSRLSRRRPLPLRPPISNPPAFPLFPDPRLNQRLISDAATKAINPLGNIFIDSYYKCCLLGIEL